MEISHEILSGCARHIRERSDEDGYFSGEFLVGINGGEAVRFDVCCRIGYGRDFSGSYVTGVQVFYAAAYACGEDGEDVSLGLKEAELEFYLKC